MLTASEEALNLRACAREPIHVPGSIQPHGILLVVDRATGLILQAAGDAASLLNFRESVLDRTLQEVLGISLAGVVQRAQTALLREPTYLGTLDVRGDLTAITITAHMVQGVAIVEVEPSGCPSSAAQTLADIRSITERVGTASDLSEACNLAASEVRRITGYDRVMIYQFLPDGSGSVIAEVKNDDLSPFLNHRYPASDIPRQARELYKRNVIRVVPDVDYAPAPLEPALTPTTNQPLDMSQCVLRSVSPVHIRYLKNMGVGASMSVSLLPRGELWGLIACHNSTPKLVPYETQEACRHVGQILSQQIRAREVSDTYRIAGELGAARDKVMRALIGVDHPRTLLSLCPDLQAIVPSDGISVSWKGNIATAGHTPTNTQVRELTAWIEQRTSDLDVFTTDRLGVEYTEAGTLAPDASGLLATVLPGDDPMTIMWFRAEQVEEVNWAGNPHKPVNSGSRVGALTPRKSFATWRETVRGRSRPWEPVEIASVQGFAPRAAFVLQQKKVSELNHLLRVANERLAALASTDGLTGLANRRAFDERLQVEWVRANRTGGSLAMIILDLDFFKQYNDHYGHAMGDECLRQVADVLQDSRRAFDLAARIGGEEFALLLPDTYIDGAKKLAETLRNSIEGLQREHMKSPKGVVTASFGVAVAMNNGNGTGRELLEAADQALYEAKGKGRNRVVSTLS